MCDDWLWQAANFRLDLRQERIEGISQASDDLALDRRQAKANSNAGWITPLSAPSRTASPRPMVGAFNGGNNRHLSSQLFVQMDTGFPVRRAVNERRPNRLRRHLPLHIPPQLLWPHLSKQCSLISGPPRCCAAVFPGLVCGVASVGLKLKAEKSSRHKTKNQKGRKPIKGGDAARSIGCKSVATTLTAVHCGHCGRNARENIRFIRTVVLRTTGAKSGVQGVILPSGKRKAARGDSHRRGSREDTCMTDLNT